MQNMHSQENGQARSDVAVSDWTTDDVAEWLNDIGFGSYSELLTNQHRVDGRALLRMNESDLRQSPISMNVLGDIKNLALCISQLKKSWKLPCHSGSRRSRHRSRRGLDEEDGVYNSSDSERGTSTTVVGSRTLRHISRHLHADLIKLFVSYIYMFFVFMLTAFVMVIVHDRVPDMDRYPPLPDMVLDNLPYIPWAFEMCEWTAIILIFAMGCVLFFHKHRFIVMRRMFALTGTVFMLRCITMLITSLSVPGVHLQCEPKVYGSLWSKLQRAIVIWTGFGMTLQGVRTCGDYMFSGHTCVVTLLNFFVTEYTPRRIPLLHTSCWILNMFAVFFILAAHEHYSIDVFIAFYITSRLFLYYHSLANNRVLRQPDSVRTRIWFPLFSYFESSIDGIVPNEYEWPVPSVQTIQRWYRTVARKMHVL